MGLGDFLGAGDLLGGGGFFLGGGPLPHFFCMNLLVRVKLGYPPNFNFLGKPLLGEIHVEGRIKKKKKKERIMPSLVATTSALACKRACARTSFAPKLFKSNTKFIFSFSIKLHVLQ